MCTTVWARRGADRRRRTRLACFYCEVFFVQCARQAGQDRELTAAAEPGLHAYCKVFFVQCARQAGQDGELTAAAPGLHALLAGSSHRSSSDTNHGRDAFPCPLQVAPPGTTAVAAAAAAAKLMERYREGGSRLRDCGSCVGLDLEGQWAGENGSLDSGVGMVGRATYGVEGKEGAKFFGAGMQEREQVGGEGGSGKEKRRGWNEGLVVRPHPDAVGEEVHLFGGSGNNGGVGGALPQPLQLLHGEGMVYGPGQQQQALQCSRAAAQVCSACVCVCEWLWVWVGWWVGACARAVSQIACNNVFCASFTNQHHT